MMFLDYRNETRKLEFIDYVHDKVRTVSLSDINSRSWLVTGVRCNDRRFRCRGNRIMRCPE